MSKPTILLACPIGESGSEERIRSDKLANYIVKPIADTLGCELTRADKIAQPGMITDQIAEHLNESTVVIVDLTGLNPNVMYELGVRQGIGKPYVLMAHKGQKLPFDLHVFRTIYYGTDIEDATTAMTELKQQLEFALSEKGQEESRRLYKNKVKDEAVEQSQKDMLDEILANVRKLLSAQINTEFVGNFPNFLEKNIVESIAVAQKEILIACDFPAPGVFSAAEGFEAYIQILEKVKQEKDISIKIQVLNKKWRDELNRLLIPMDKEIWSALLSDKSKSFSKNLEEFNERYKVKISTPEQLYDKFSELDDITFERLEKITDGPIHQINSFLPMYLWVIDSRKAIFSIPTFPDQSDKSLDKIETSYGFETSNIHLITSLERIWHWYYKISKSNAPLLYNP